MMPIECIEDIISENRTSLERLATMIKWSKGSFTPILGHCNLFCLPEKITARLKKEFSLDIEMLRIEGANKSLGSQIQDKIKDRIPQALMIFGLPNIANIDRILAELNGQRDNLVSQFPCPLILWVNDEIIVKLARQAPDFSTICQSVSFTCPTRRFTDCIQQVAKEILDKIIEKGAGILWRNGIPLPSTDASDHHIFLESFLKRSQLLELKRNVKDTDLTPELKASLEFLLGHSSEGSTSERQTHYEDSLNCWQALENREYQGAVLYCLGLLWNTYGIRYPAQKRDAFKKAQEYYQKCVENFEAYHPKHPELVGKFINAWAEGYKRLEDWDELEKVAKKGLAIHRKYNDHYGFREARAKSFLAEVAIFHEQWQEAENLAQEACLSIEKVESESVPPEEKKYFEWRRTYHYGWYLLSLGKARHHLGKIDDAIDTLEKAKKVTKPEYDPALYIKILEELRTGYKEKCEYQKAFENKQEKQSIEQQFGRQAFIGAGQLKPKRLITNPAFLIANPNLFISEIDIYPKYQEIAPEIEASGHQNIVKELIDDLRRNEKNLLILLGPSGVGKSSLLQAGLIPELQRKNDQENRRFLPVFQTNYEDWIGQLGKLLTEELQQRDIRVDSALDSLATIVEQFNYNFQRNLKVILIFDKLEKFFAINQHILKRNEFYEFLRNSLRTGFVKIILCLREDNLNYVLECDRYFSHQDDLLGIEVLTPDKMKYIGNFSTEEAQNCIRRLTQNTQFRPEEELIQQVVEDLAKKTGEVRPIELQLLGAQLEKNGITTQQQYTAKIQGDWRNLITEYIEEVVVDDCGQENKKLAQLVLYLLTGNPPDIRPLKTQEKLEECLREVGCNFDHNSLRLVLTILKDSGLILSLKRETIEQYQISQDYFVTPIQQKAERDFKKESLELQQTKGELREVFDLELLDVQSQKLFQNGELLKALYKTVELGEKLQNAKVKNEALSDKITDSKEDTRQRLQELVYDIQEFKSLEGEDGHTSDVYGVSFSPDGQKLASASWDKTIKLWNLKGELLYTSSELEGHTSCVNTVQFSPDGKMLASGGGDRLVKLWRVEDSQLILWRDLEGHKDWSREVKFHPKGNLIASASNDKTIKLWTIDGDLFQTLSDPHLDQISHENRVFSICFSQDGRLLISASDDHTIKLWQFDQEKYSLWKIIPCGASFHTVAISPDGRMIAAGGWDRKIRLWDLEALQNCEDNVKNVLQFWTQENWRKYEKDLLKTLEGDEMGSGHLDCIKSVIFSPNGQFLACGSNDKTVKLWDVKSHTLLKTFKGHSNWINDVSFCPCCQDPLILASASDDNTIKLWKFKPFFMNSLEGKDGHQNKIHSASFSPDGQMIASGGWDNMIKLWDLKGNLPHNLPKNLDDPERHTDWVWEVSFSPDGKTLASASGDHQVKIWNLQEGTLQRNLEENECCVHSVSFSPDGTILASGGKQIKFWCLIDDRWEFVDPQPSSLHHDLVWQVRFSPKTYGGNFLLASGSGDQTVKLWKIKKEEGKTLTYTHETLDGQKGGHSEWVNSVSFSPDGRLLASASNDQTIILWSLTSDGTLDLDKKPLKIRGHHARVYSVAFCPNENYPLLASASADNTIKIWSLDGTLLQTLEGHQEWVNSVNFSPDGDLLVSTSSDKTVKLWNIKTIKETYGLELRGQRNLASLIDRGRQWLQKEKL